MKDYNIHQISGWLNASGNSLLDNLPAGTPIFREVTVKPEKYWTGYVSTSGGSFKQPGQSGNWYGTSFDVADAEVRPSEPPIYEYSRLNQDTPVWNMHKLPEPFLAAIAADGDLESGQFAKSQFVVECLQALEGTGGVSGVYFPSRRADGGVVILNPQAVSTTIVFTGQSLPTGLG
ncbi:MAG TPA: hypothetical protein VFA77_10110 [Candidatus Eisenbacteria bacterium]|jgi:hypothetical protein|nr:hypothetical protein [Candidatus Eisenbacteria bacterium]